MQALPVEKYKGLFSQQFDTIIYEDYFSNDRVIKDEVEYSDLSKPAEKNVYIMRRVNSDDLQNQFVSTLTQDQQVYRNNGCLIKRGFIPPDLIDEYFKLRERLNLGIGEFDTVTNYVEYLPVRRIACYPPLIKLLNELHSAEMGLIFTLTKLQSTQRGWHQDAYLDHDDALPRLAVWIALGDVTSDCGPCEYVEGSHWWPTLSNLKVNDFLKEEYHWPAAQRNKKPGVLPWGRISEAFVDPAVHKEMARQGVKQKKFIAKKGDVLIWYGRLMHRGSKATNTGATRPAMIGHYAPVFERDRGIFLRDDNGGFFQVPNGKYDIVGKYER